MIDHLGWDGMGFDRVVCLPIDTTDPSHVALKIKVLMRLAAFQKLLAMVTGVPKCFRARDLGRIVQVSPCASTKTLQWGNC